MQSYKDRQQLQVKWHDIYLLVEETVNIEYATALIELELTKLKVLQDLRSKKERFLYFIKQEKSYFVDKIDNKWDVQKIVCVRAKLNNPRIIRQSGLFFLFGMGDIKGEPITFSKFIKGIKEHYSPTIQEITNPTILISGQAKEMIIKELRALGISEEILMPEIDSVAKSIKNRYSH